jgi:hypothetical protein
VARNVSSGQIEPRPTGPALSRREVDGRSRLAPSVAPHRTSHLPAVSVVGPRGFEPRTCGLRVWCRGAGQRAAWPRSCAFASLWYPSFPVVSRSFTGMRRAHDLGWRCHFDHTHRSNTTPHKALDGKIGPMVDAGGASEEQLLTDARRGDKCGVPTARRATSGGALRPLLLDARLDPGRRGRAPGVAPRSMAGAWPASMAGAHCGPGHDQRLPAAVLTTTPQDAVVRPRSGPLGHARSLRPGDRSGLARALAGRSARER